LDNLDINEVVYKVAWEPPVTSGKANGDESAADEGVLDIGPVGEYLEVIDYDPASGYYYPPVDLNDPLLLAQDGLAPSEGNPQFHQQMVYAVAMTTIRHFEHALGRAALWRPLRISESHITGADFQKHNDSRLTDAQNDGQDPSAIQKMQADCGDEVGAIEFKTFEKYVRRLRIYPHALRQANAYYSPDKRALLFGYFTSAAAAGSLGLPGGTVFTCLSHDIIAHETTHALLDGMHGKFIEPTQPDALAFHEAFADIVALLQHFSFPEVVRGQISRTRGDLTSQNLLGQLAQEMGTATGQYGALRDAIGEIDEKTGEWRLQTSDPRKLYEAEEPHERGAILVAAVFDAFLAIYKSRVADLLRIATSGSGILPAGALHPDLVNRLASEASKSAQHVLLMCIRALDYCPPIDVTFGDYLRALITADSDLVPDDERGYRVAFLDAFRRRGIYPTGIRTLSVESLRWPVITETAEEAAAFQPLSALLRTFQDKTRYFKDREEIFTETLKMRACLHEFMDKKYSHHNVAAFEQLTGLILAPGKELPEPMKKAGLSVAKRDNRPIFEVHSLRPAIRVGPGGNVQNQLIISILQRCQSANGQEASMPFRGGCTLILDLASLSFRYCIPKRLDDVSRWQRQREYWSSGLTSSLRAMYLGNPFANGMVEPFAFLHNRL
jgi:hypothetical protein